MQANSTQSGRHGHRWRCLRESRVEVDVDLDRRGPVDVATDLDELSDAVTAIASGGGFALRLYSEGGPCADMRLIVEDCGYELGAALRDALGDSIKGARCEFDCQVDGARVRVGLAFDGGRDAVVNGDFGVGRMGGLPAELLPVFFHSLACTLGARILLDVRGGTTAQTVAACSRGVGLAIREVCRR
jgi:imidazoleglycerol phosphate dehydratase HisB